MKKILCLFLTATMILSFFVPAGVYAAESTVLEEVYSFDFTKYKTGTAGDYTSQSLGDGVIIRSYDTATDQVCITEDSEQGKVMKFGPAKTSYDSGICMTRKPVAANNPVISFKIKVQAAKSSTWVNPACIDVFSSSSRILRLWLRWGSNGGTDYPRNLYLRNQTAGGWGSENLIADNFNNGTPGWIDVKLIFDHTKQTYDVFVGGVKKATAESYYDSTEDIDISQINFYCSGENGSVMVDDIKVFKSVATELTLTSPAADASNADLTDTLTFTSNNENLVVDDAVLTITPEDEEAVTILNAAYVDTVNKKKIHFDLSVAAFEPDYETKYTVSVSGIKDTDGNDVKTVTAAFTTREPQLIVGEGTFSYNAEQNKMDGSVTILNERKDSPLDATVIFAAFDENELKDAAMQKDLVTGEKLFSKSLVYNSEYTYKAFIWNSIDAMNPIGSYEPAFSIESEAAIDYLSGKGKIDGFLKKGGCATALIFKPGCDVTQLNEDGSNLADIIAYIGESECKDDGSFGMDFELNFANEANGSEITVLTGGSGIDKPDENTLTYYSKQTVENIFKAITEAENGQAIADLISGKTTVNGVEANTILNLDTGAYEELADKTTALENLIGMKFTDIESVHTAFNAAVEKQKAEESQTSEFSPIHFDFEPVGGVVSPGWSQSEKGTYAVAKTEAKSESLSNGKENYFHRFTFGETEDIPSAVNYTERELRTRLSLDKAVLYNNTPKVISFKFRIDGKAKQSSQIEMLDSSGTRGTKEFIFSTTASNVYGVDVSTGVSDGDKWHTFEIVMDGTGILDGEKSLKKKYFFLDGKLIKEAELGKDTALTSSFDIKHLQFYTSFPVGVTPENHMDFDELKIEEYNTPRVVETIPEKDGSGIDVTNKIKVIFDKAVAGVTDENIALYGGDGTVKVSGVGMSLDNKTVTFTLNKKLDYSSSYKVVLSGIKDSFGQDITPYIFEFSTRNKQILAGEPVYLPASGNTTDCIVEVTNEDSTELSATVVFASFDGDEMTEAKVQTKTFTGTEEFISNLKESDDSKIRMFVWNSMGGMQPLKLYPSASSARTKVKYDYKTGKGNITGTLLTSEADAVATVLILKPGKSANDNDAVAFIGEISCDEKGNFSKAFEFELSDADIEAGKTATVFAGAKGVKKPAEASFKCYGDEVVTSVLDAIKEASDADTVAGLIEGKTTVSDVKANDILQLETSDGSDYANLKDKKAVCEALKGTEHTDISSIWNAFDTAVKTQKDYEARAEEALSVLNTAPWDKMEEKLGEYTGLLNLKLTVGSYTSLTDTEKITLYKNLANTYTFTFGADINGYIESISAGIIAERGSNTSGGSGSSGGSGGGKDRNDTEMKVTGIVANPGNETSAEQSFNDLSDVMWAKESIDYLAKKNIVNGIGNNLFAPNSPVTREQIVKIMVLAGGLQLTEESVSFSDVSNGDWFSQYVATGVNYGLVNGMGDGIFGSGRNVTRQELAVFLTRLAEITGKKLSGQKDSTLYNDDSEISGYARDSVYLLYNAGIMNGMGDGMFVPTGNVTRAMAAKAVYELLQYGK